MAGMAGGKRAAVAQAGWRAVGTGVGNCGASAGDKGSGATRARGIGDGETTGNAAKGWAAGSSKDGMAGAGRYLETGATGGAGADENDCA